MGRPGRPRKDEAPAPGNDAESSTIIYQGATIEQLSRLFKMKGTTLKGKIAGNVLPCGQRARSDIYHVYEVAPYLVKPIDDIEGYIRRMHPYDLPKMLSKEYWAGQRAKQEYEIKAGDLWPSTKVVEEIGEIFKLVKMGALLTTDAIERRVELSDSQRAIVQSQMDGMLEDLYARIQERYKPKEDQGGIPEVHDDEEL